MICREFKINIKVLSKRSIVVAVKGQMLAICK